MLMIIVSPSVTSTSTSSCATPRSTAPCSSASTAGLVSARGLISCAPSSVSAVRSVIGSPRSRRFLELHRNATDRVVLAKGVALPVVGHEELAARQRAGRAVDQGRFFGRRLLRRRDVLVSHRLVRRADGHLGAGMVEVELGAAAGLGPPARDLTGADHLVQRED